MASKVSVCNAALIKFGQKPIMSLDDDNDRASACKGRYDDILKLVLASHPWNFAVRRSVLARLTEAPAFGFSYRYQLPVNCLRILAINPESEGYSADYIYGFGSLNYNVFYDTPAYKIEGRELLTNSEEVKMIYVELVEDPSVYSPLFIDALSTRLAAEICVRLNASPSIQEKMLQMYELVMRRARSIDASEGTPDSLYSDQFAIYSRL